MKAMKAAAVLAGSLAVAGSAAPAFAADPAPVGPASAGPMAELGELVGQGLDHATPVGTNMLDAEHGESTIKAVKGLASGGVPGNLLGGLPAGK